MDADAPTETKREQTRKGAIQIELIILVDL